VKVIVLDERGYEYAMLGLSLSYNQLPKDMPAVAMKLLPQGSSHVKFLESIIVWLDITAPRYWWIQADTYRAPQGDEEGLSIPSGISKQSESTMHTLMKRELTQEDFAYPLFPDNLVHLNYLIYLGNFERVVSSLPAGFLQRRIVTTNYKVLRHMIEQRRNHRLAEWQTFISEVSSQVKHPELLPTKGRLGYHDVGDFYSGDEDDDVTPRAGKAGLSPVG